jgi:hypothetical protein
VGEGWGEGQKVKLKNVIATPVLLLAGAVTHAAGWTPPLTVERAFTEESDLLIVYTSGGTEYTSGCAANAWSINVSSETRRSRAWATILAALTTGQKIQFWYRDYCGVWNYHDATSVMLLKP